MPCVCLVNTFACWKSYRAQKLAVRKAALTETQDSAAQKILRHDTEKTSAAKVATAEILRDGAVIKVPHTRKKLAMASQATADAMTATQTDPAARSATDAASIVQSASGISSVLTAKPVRKKMTLYRQTKLTQRTRSYGVAQKPGLAKLMQKTHLTRLAQKTRRAKRTLGTNDAPIIDYEHPPVHLTRADLINAESQLGSTIFGPIPAGHRREFFHDRNNVWIWHEDWSDGQNNPHQMTVRYEVRPTGVYKKIAQGKYLKLEGDELENFRKATHAYLYVIKKNLYQRLNMHQTA